jgi:ssDNA-binding Zn-finger/Zn-ribbon topoisomerase 1
MVERNFEMKSFPGDKCPRGTCDGVLVKRRNKFTGEYFLGCSNFPDCDHTEPIEEPEE